MIKAWKAGNGFRCVFYRDRSVPAGVSAFFMSRQGIIRLRIKDKERILSSNQKQRILAEMHEIATRHGYVFSSLWQETTNERI